LRNNEELSQALNKSYLTV